MSSNFLKIVKTCNFTQNYNHMKNLFTLIALFIGTVIFSQDFKFETEMIDYGKIAKGSKGERVFVFTNIGDAPLIISNVVSSCGCTIPEKPTNPILPGKKGEIKVSYDTNRLGGFSKTITITSNAKAGQKAIRIKGLVVTEDEINLEKTKSVVNN